MLELRRESTVMFPKAPAGTGKSYVIAAYVNELYRKLYRKTRNDKGKN